MIEYWFAAMAVLGGAALFCPFIPARFRALSFALLATVAAVLLTVAVWPVLATGKPLTGRLPLAWPLGPIGISLDALSAFFVMIVAWFGLPALFAAPALVRRSALAGSRAHWVFFGVLLFSMQLVLAVDTLVGFLVAWELMSLSSFFLVIQEHERPGVRQAGLHYLIAMHVSFILLLIATVLSGASAFSDLSAVLSGNAALVLLFIGGFAVKSGLMPFHGWLPEAYPAAPAHATAIMSAVMSKLGIYGIVRIVTATGVGELVPALVVLVLSVVTAVCGIIYAVSRRDLKEMLAYSSIENIGIIGIAIGTAMLGSALGSPGLVVAGSAGLLFQVICHALYKTTLFCGAGAVEAACGTRDFEKLGGLAQRMPRTATAFFLMAFATAALPPFGGFISEFLIYSGLVSGVSFAAPFMTTLLVLVMAALAMTAAVALLGYTRAYGIVFSGLPRSPEAAAATEPGGAGQVVLLLPVALLLLVGCFPQFILDLLFVPLSLISSALLPPGLVPEVPVGIVAGLRPDLAAAALPIACFAGLTLVLWLLRRLLLARRVIGQSATWGCGYTKADARVQYSAASFSEPFMTVVRPLMQTETSGERVRGFFPRTAESQRRYQDPFRGRLLARFGRLVTGIFDRFAWIQSGNMQQYIFYGLVCLLVMLVWALVLP